MLRVAFYLALLGGPMHSYWLSLEVHVINSLYCCDSHSPEACPYFDISSQCQLHSWHLVALLWTLNLTYLLHIFNSQGLSILPPNAYSFLSFHSHHDLSLSLVKASLLLPRTLHSRLIIHNLARSNVTTTDLSALLHSMEYPRGLQ